MFDFILEIISQFGVSSGPKIGKYVFTFLALFFAFLAFMTGSQLWILTIVCGVIAVACLMIELAN